MATESNSTTDKGLGVALACAAVVAVGAVLMVTGAPRGLSEEREQVVGSVAKTVVDKASVPVTIIK